MPLAISTTGPSARNSSSTSQESRDRLASNGSNIIAMLLRPSTAVGQAVVRPCSGMGLNGGMNKSGGGAARALATVFFLVVVAAAIFVPMTRDSVPLPGGDDGGTLGGTSSSAPAKAKAAPPPKAWDPRLAPLAAATARLRGLQFKHPVAVKFETPKEFEKEFDVDQKPTK